MVKELEWPVLNPDLKPTEKPGINWNINFMSSLLDGHDTKSKSTKSFVALVQNLEESLLRKA